MNEFKNTKLTAETFNANHDERVLRMRYLDNVYMHHITLTSSSRSQSVVQQKSAHLKKGFLFIRRIASFVFASTTHLNFNSRHDLLMFAS